MRMILLVAVGLTLGVLAAACGADSQSDSEAVADPGAVAEEGGGTTAPVQTTELIPVARPTTTTRPVTTTTRPVTTTTRPVTTTTLPTVMYLGRTYTCDDETYDGWECTSGTSRVYCSGLSSPTDCSELWYPHQLAQVDLVVWNGSTYVCDWDGACQTYRGGGPPPSTLNILSPDVWCDGFTCIEYDPAEWFEISNLGRTYLCTEPFGGLHQYDCVTYSGGPPPDFISPDLYCDGPEGLLQCSELWYPYELAISDMVEYGGRSYVCKATPGFGNDFDCYTYTGGDPQQFSFGGPNLFCTRSLGWQCRTDFYPSEMDGVFFATIDAGEHVCEETYAGSECWSYWSGSPRDAMLGRPDFYCNNNGCDRYGYP